jgi:hypothetical protein
VGADGIPLADEGIEAGVDRIACRAEPSNLRRRLPKWDPQDGAVRWHSAPAAGQRATGPGSWGVVRYGVDSPGGVGTVVVPVGGACLPGSVGARPLRSATGSSVGPFWAAAVTERDEAGVPPEPIADGAGVGFRAVAPGSSWACEPDEVSSRGSGFRELAIDEELCAVARWSSSAAAVGKLALQLSQLVGSSACIFVPFTPFQGGTGPVAPAGPHGTETPDLAGFPSAIARRRPAGRQGSRIGTGLEDSVVRSSSSPRSVPREPRGGLIGR